MRSLWNSVGLKRWEGKANLPPWVLSWLMYPTAVELPVEPLLWCFAAPECSARYLRPGLHKRCAHLVFGQLQHHGWCAAGHIAAPGKSVHRQRHHLICRYGKSHLTLIVIFFLDLMSHELRWHSGNSVAPPWHVAGFAGVICFCKLCASCDFVCCVTGAAPCFGSSWGCCCPCCTSPEWRTSSRSTSWARASSGTRATELPPSSLEPAAACATRADRGAQRAPEPGQTQQLWAVLAAPDRGWWSSWWWVRARMRRSGPSAAGGWVCASLNLLLSDCWAITQPENKLEKIATSISRKRLRHVWVFVLFQLYFLTPSERDWFLTDRRGGYWTCVG